MLTEILKEEKQLCGCMEKCIRAITRTARSLIRLIIRLIVFAVLWLLAVEKLPELEVVAPAITETAKFVLATANAGAEWLLQLIK